MGFTRDTAFTTDADLRDKAVFEPNLRLRLDSITADGGAAKSDFSSQHIAAANAVFDRILAAGVDPALVTNTTTFKPAAMYYILFHFFLALIEQPADPAHIKYVEYKKLWDSFWETVNIVTSESENEVVAIRNKDYYDRMEGLYNTSEGSLPEYEDYGGGYIK